MSRVFDYLNGSKKKEELGCQIGNGKYKKHINFNRIRPITRYWDDMSESTRQNLADALLKQNEMDYYLALTEYEDLPDWFKRRLKIEGVG